MSNNGGGEGIQPGLAKPTRDGTDARPVPPPPKLHERLGRHVCQAEIVTGDHAGEYRWVVRSYVAYDLARALDEALSKLSDTERKLIVGYHRLDEL